MLIVTQDGATSFLLQNVPSVACAGSNGKNFNKHQHFKSCLEQSFGFHQVSLFSDCLHTNNIEKDKKKINQARYRQIYNNNLQSFG